MATVVNNPPANGDGRNNSGFLLGVIVLIILVILFVFYGLPMLGGGGGAGTGGAGTQTPQVNVPEQVDVNVDQQP